MSGYEVAHIDELESMPVNEGEFVWRPVRRRFGITAFGTNVYTGDKGKRVIEAHSEQDGHEEMDVVLRGHATFTLGEDEVDASPGTLVFVRPGTRRGAVAAEDETAILAIGAKPGVVFEPSPWENIFVAFSYVDVGDYERAREAMREAVAGHPDAWQGYYNFACLEARAGDKEAALAHLLRAAELDADAARKAAEHDSDLDPIRNEPGFPA